ncbi:MAG: hypothetical protein SQA66_05585 [Candidatus Fervidibacter sacchari]
MRRVWVSLILTLLAVLSLIESQQATKTFQWHIVFQPQSGGLLSLFRHPEIEAPRLTGMAIYTDWGILKPGRYEVVGSQNERNPKINERKSDGVHLASVEGQLKDKQGQPCGLSYRVVHRLDADALMLDISLSAERSFPSMNGFLATVLNFAGANEWFACTQKGWVFAEITEDKRVFQSAQTPLPSTGSDSTLGVANSKTGLALKVTLTKVEPEDGLDNVIIHANPKGTGGIFFAWCDGITVRRMEEGDNWRLLLKVQILPLDRLFSGTE